MKLVRFLKPMPEHSANIGDEMAFSDEKAAEFVAKGRAVFITAPPLVVELEAEPDIVGKGRASPSEAGLGAILPKEGVAHRYVAAPEQEPVPELAGDYEDEPIRRGPGRPRKHF